MEQRGAAKLFYQGLIQAAVGCYKADFGVYNGAVRLLARALGKFESAGSVDVPFEVDRFIRDIRTFLKLIEARGPERLASIEPAEYPVIWASGEIPRDAVAHGGVLDRD